MSAKDLENKMKFDKQIRGYLGAMIVFMIIIGIMVFLGFVEIPEANNDVFKLIIGVMVGTLGSVIFTILGKDPEELQQYKLTNEKLREENKQLKERMNGLEKQLMDLQNEVIKNLSVLADKYE